MYSFLFVAVSVVAASTFDCSEARLCIEQAEAPWQLSAGFEAVQDQARVRLAGQFTSATLPDGSDTAERVADLQSYLELHNQATESGFGPSLTPWLQLRSISGHTPAHSVRPDEMSRTLRVDTPDECS